MQGTAHIREQSVEGACVLTVAGELDVAAAPLLSEKLNALIRTGSGDVVVDLMGVTFVDSTGLAVLLNALRRLTRARRRMAVVIGNGAVQRAFEVTRLHWTFDVFDSVESALERSRGG
jgi:anti-sigma B factor antagonist